MNDKSRDFVIVSGLSGAGKSVALHTLEDLGYYCIDNLPIFLLRELALGLDQGGAQGDFAGTAVGIDARNRIEDLASLPGLLEELRSQGIACRMLYLEASAERLMTRFSETRRRHPLSGRMESLEEALQREREILAPVRAAAEIRLDTSLTNVHELRDLVRDSLGGALSERAPVLLKSFGFKCGMPKGADFVFDLRCLPNPHWNKDLRALTGRDQPVIDFLEAASEVAEMRADLERFLDHWIPRFKSDGRAYLTIALGCTGGQHRSVYMVESLRDHLANQGHQVLVRHRELP